MGDIVRNESADLNLNKCIVFLDEIGIITEFSKIIGASFLPGLTILSGQIIIDIENLKYPGDLLHEAGHIAVVPASERKGLNATNIEYREHRASEEMMAIAWSYAACIHLEIDPHFVFHVDGYKGGGSEYVENFNNQHYFGLPMLQWKGMAVDNNNSLKQNIKPYPHMIRWVLE